MCKYVWWVCELAMSKRGMYWCTIHFCGCELLILECYLKACKYFPYFLLLLPATPAI